MRSKDFDRYLDEKENRKMLITIFGRKCEVPTELPYYYVLKVENMLRGGDNIPHEENVKIVKQMLKPDDFEFVTNHPDFKLSTFFDLIAFAYLRADNYEEESKEPAFETEDERKAKETQDSKSKKDQSAR